MALLIHVGSNKLATTNNFMEKTKKIIQQLSSNNPSLQVLCPQQVKEFLDCINAIMYVVLLFFLLYLFAEN